VSGHRAGRRDRGRDPAAKPGPDRGDDGDLDALEARLGHRFGDRGLLLRALTHIGVTARPDENYERLEFLGDRVLGVVVARLVYDAWPAAAEGELANRYNLLVRRDTCAAVAREEKTGGRDKPVILGDVVEAVIAALYLDAGFDVAAAFVERHWRPRLATGPASGGRDAKSTLQEWAQGRGAPVPVYRVADRSGPDHAPEFVVSVEVAGVAPVEASGPSRRLAEQNAARLLLVREKVWSA
jgi:ribonuclease-3